MATMTREERLAAVRRHLDELESRSRALPAESKARVQRHLAVLDAETTSTRSSLEADRTRRETADARREHELDDRLHELDSRVEIAGHSLAADLSDDRTSFRHAVHAELQSWDDYFHWLKSTAETQDEKTLAALKEWRDALAASLDEAGRATSDRWAEQKTRVDAAREKLEQKTDELAAKLH